MGDKIKLTLSARWIGNGKVGLSKGLSEQADTVALVGDNIYNGTYFPADEIEKAYHTMERQPFNLDHSDRVEDEIGFVKDVKFENGKMLLTPIICEHTAKAQIAEGYIKERKNAGKTPEVSIEVWASKAEEEVEINNEKIKVPVARDYEFDGMALVTRGACSPSAGCGVGIDNIDNASTTINFDSFSIQFDSGTGESGVWSWQNEKEQIDEATWTTKFINNLPDAAFAYIEPGGKKDSEGKTTPRSLRHFPHHTGDVKKGTDNKTVDLPHLRNELARVSQSKISDAGKKKALAHLIKHAKALKVGDYSEESKGGNKMSDEEKTEEQPEETPEEKEEVTGAAVKTETDCSKEIDSLKKEIEEAKEALKAVEALKTELKESKKKIAELESKGHKHTLKAGGEEEKPDPDKNMLEYMRKVSGVM